MFLQSDIVLVAAITLLLLWWVEAAIDGASGRGPAHNSRLSQDGMLALPAWVLILEGGLRCRFTGKGFGGN